MFFCRVCQSPLRIFLDFGRMPLANAFLCEEDFSSEYLFHLQAGFCSSCYMVQLAEQPQAKSMFHQTYPFFTSSSARMREHFHELAIEVERKYLPGQKGFVLELGSNDGTFLSNFISQPSIRCYGIDPALNCAEKAALIGVKTRVGFFSREMAQEIYANFGPANVICAANVMCHIADIHSVLDGVEKMLAPNGVFIFEDPSCWDMLRQTAYDQIYDEHVFIFSALSLRYALALHGLEMINLKRLDTHGGSIRYTVARKGVFPVSESVENWIRMEWQAELQNYETYVQFRIQTEQSRDELVSLLRELKQAGKKVAGYAATSKSTTVLNYCGLTSTELAYIADTTSEKQGRFSPGVHIPIKSREHFGMNSPDYAVLFGWNHRKEILSKEIRFMEMGGTWITYIPKVQKLRLACVDESCV